MTTARSASRSPSRSPLSELALATAAFPVEPIHADARLGIFAPLAAEPLRDHRVAYEPSDRELALASVLEIAECEQQLPGLDCALEILPVIEAVALERA